MTVFCHFLFHCYIYSYIFQVGSKSFQGFRSMGANHGTQGETSPPEFGVGTIMQIFSQIFKKKYRTGPLKHHFKRKIQLWRPLQVIGRPLGCARTSTNGKYHKKKHVLHRYNICIRKSVITHFVLMHSYECVRIQSYEFIRTSVCAPLQVTVHPGYGNVVLSVLSVCNVGVL